MTSAMSTREEAPARPRPSRVALFTTCMADFAAPGPVGASIEVLRAMGMQVEIPRGQTCCGQPALNSGYPREAARVLHGLLEALDGFDAVVTPAGSCAAMVVAHAEELLGPEAARSAGVSRLYEFTQFVVAYGADLDLRLDATVTWHDSCHMTRFLGERSSPRELLGRITGLRLVEMVDPATCCGFGGTFSVKFPEVSVAMGQVKLDHAVGTDADYLVSADPGCLLHLQSIATRSGRSGPAFRHIAELTRDALQGGGAR